MKNLSVLFSIFLFLPGIHQTAHGEETVSQPALSLGFVPSLQFPFAAAAGTTKPSLMGGSAAIRVQCDLSGQRGLSLRGGLEYYLNPYVSGNSSSKKNVMTASSSKIDKHRSSDAKEVLLNPY